jgi:hypothetical protein
VELSLMVILREAILGRQGKEVRGWSTQIQMIKTDGQQFCSCCYEGVATTFISVDRSKGSLDHTPSSQDHEHVIFLGPEGKPSISTRSHLMSI